MVIIQNCLKSMKTIPLINKKTIEYQVEVFEKKCAYIPTDYPITAYLPTVNHFAASVPSTNPVTASAPNENYVT